jgi:hypothetical protein
MEEERERERDGERAHGVASLPYTGDEDVPKSSWKYGGSGKWEVAISQLRSGSRIRQSDK